MLKHGWFNAMIFGFVWLIVVNFPLQFFHAASAAQGGFPWFASFQFQFVMLAVFLTVSQLVFRGGREDFGYVQAVAAGARFSLVCAVGLSLFVLVSNSIAGGLSHIFRDPADDTVAASLALITLIAGILETLVISGLTRKS